MIQCQVLVAMCDTDYGSADTPMDSPACTKLIHTYWSTHFPDRLVVPVDIRNVDAGQ